MVSLLLALTPTPPPSILVVTIIVTTECAKSCGTGLVSPPGACTRPSSPTAGRVYTSGEHCPMCAAAHGWVGLGHIVYASSSEQLAAWLGVPPPPVRTLPINAVVPGVVVEGQVPELAERVRELHRRFHAARHA
ncbi:hypothetical protein [Actinoallomurus sp. CA-150999]|uniref:hypothetical protein n=1 Tax=Actinoallomurus sp. CA-150999 TaxID=3239887 RepID=UPI003D8CE746